MNSNSPLAQQSPVAPQGEVTKEIEVMQKNLEALMSQIGQLENAVTPILAERKDAEGASTSQPEPVRVPLAHMLWNLNCTLVEQENRLRSIIGRLEL